LSFIDISSYFPLENIKFLRCENIFAPKQNYRSECIHLYNVKANNCGNMKWWSHHPCRCSKNM